MKFKVQFLLKMGVIQLDGAGGAKNTIAKATFDNLGLELAMREGSTRVCYNRIHQIKLENMLICLV